MSELRFAQVDVDRKTHLLEEPYLVPGLYNWANVMGGDWLEYAEIKGRVNEYDVIMVCMTTWDLDTRLISQLKEESPDTTIMVTADYAIELWNEGFNISWLAGELARADILFAPHPAMRDFMQGMFPDKPVALLNHPVDVDRLRKEHKPRIKRDDNIIYMIHRYNNFWISGYLAAQQLTRPIHAVVANKEIAKNLIKYFKDMAIGGTYTQYIKWAANQMYAYDGYQTIHSTGRLQLDNAILGIPTVGSETVHNQKMLFPQLTTTPWNLKDQIYLLQRLIDDRDFWEETVNEAWENVQDLNYANRKIALMEVIKNVGKTEIHSDIKTAVPTGTT